MTLNDIYYKYFRISEFTNYNENYVLPLTTTGTSSEIPCYRLLPWLSTARI